MPIEHVLGGLLPVCRPEDGLRAAARQMLDRDCACLMVTADGSPDPLVGFVTQQDLFAALLRCPGDLDSLHVRDAMSEEVELVEAAAMTQALALERTERPLLMLRSDEGAILALFWPVPRASADGESADREAGAPDLGEATPR